jgi:hypothetical protein
LSKSTHSFVFFSVWQSHFPCYACVNKSYLIPSSCYFIEIPSDSKDSSREVYSSSVTSGELLLDYNFLNDYRNISVVEVWNSWKCKSSINAILLNLTVHKTALSNSSVNHLFRTVSRRTDAVRIKEKFHTVWMAHSESSCKTLWWCCKKTGRLEYT